MFAVSVCERLETVWSWDGSARDIVSLRLKEDREPNVRLRYVSLLVQC
jgi:hypothetical protein